MLKRRILGLGLAAMIAALLAVAPALGQTAASDQDLRNTKVTLELTNTPIRAAIQALFRFVPFNYTIGTTVDGMISVSLTDVPFEQALRAITRINEPKLTYRRAEGNLYEIDVKKEADLTAMTTAAMTTTTEETTTTEPRLVPQKIQLNFGRVDLISQLFSGKVTIVRDEEDQSGYGGGGYGGMGGGYGGMGGGYGGMGGYGGSSYGGYGGSSRYGGGYGGSSYGGYGGSSRYGGSSYGGSYGGRYGGF